MVSFLVDILRFEADRSSKVAIFGLWIVSNSTFGWRESLWLVAKKKRKKSNKLAWFYFMHTPFVRKIVSNPSTCLFVQRFFYERKCRFIENIFRPLCSHFVRLSSPTHSLFNQKKSSFGKRQVTWHYESQAGSICRELATLLPHGWVIVMWLISVSSFIFPWAHNGPDISIYRTGADGVSSCLAINRWVPPSALLCSHLIIFQCAFSA